MIVKFELIFLEDKLLYRSEKRVSINFLFLIVVVFYIEVGDFKGYYRKFDKIELKIFKVFFLFFIVRLIVIIYNIV